MKKEDAIKAGLSQDVAEFVLSKERDNKALNQEGMEIGDKITIVGVADKVSEFTGDDDQVRKYVDVMTTGDRNTISISRLVGTAKRARYFAKDRKETQVIEGGYKDEDLLVLPRHEADALIAVLGLVGKTYQVVAIAEDCGIYSQTYYLFAEV